MVAVAFLAASLFTLALGKPLARNMRIHERRDSPPAGYALTGAASPDTVLNVRIALAQSNPAGLEEALYDVSTPSSPNYGKHLSKQEVGYLSRSSRNSALDLYDYPRLLNSLCRLLRLLLPSILGCRRTILLQQLSPLLAIGLALRFLSAKRMICLTPTTMSTLMRAPASKRCGHYRIRFLRIYRATSKLFILLSSTSPDCHTETKAVYAKCFRDSLTHSLAFLCSVRRLSDPSPS